jgi:hypothetical protein
LKAATQGETRRFDFTKLAERSYAELRPARILAILVTVFVCGLELVALLKILGWLPGYAPGSSAPLLTAVIGGLAMVGLSLSAYLLNFGVRPASSLLLDAQGIQLLGAAGKSRVYPWNGSRAGLTMVVWVRKKPSAATNPAHPSGDREYSIVGIRPRHTSIPAEAFTAILSEARGRRYQITSRSREGSLFHQTVYRFVPTE